MEVNSQTPIGTKVKHLLTGETGTIVPFPGYDAPGWSGFTYFPNAVFVKDTQGETWAWGSQNLMAE